AIEDYISDLLNTHDNFTKFLFNKNIYDAKNDKAATVDLLAIDKNGKTSIYNFEFLNFGEDKEDIPFGDREKINKYLGQSKQILKNNYGITEFDKTRAIPILINYKEQKTKGIYDVKQVKIGGVNTDLTKFDYLLPVPESGERTGN